MTASANGSAEPLQGFHAGLTIGQAASTLGVSPSTVRRWVRSGHLASNQVSVGDGFEYRIPLKALEAMKGSATPCTKPSAEPAMEPSTAGSASPSADASADRSAALAAYNAQLVAPLAAVIEHQAETIRDQAERLGRQGAELERATSTVVALGDELAAAEASRRRDHRRLRIGLAVAGALAVVVGLAPAWVR